MSSRFLGWVQTIACSEELPLSLTLLLAGEDYRTPRGQ
jgi:hypothetical protein